MICICNGNLHEQRVDRSNRFGLEQFLYPDHWIPPKPREYIKYIWSVVRLRFGPVATPLIGLMNLLWRTIATSHITRCTTDTHLYTLVLPPLKTHAYGTHQQIKDMHQLLLIGSIRHHKYTLMMLLSTLNINLRWNIHSITVKFNIPQEDFSLWMLLFIGCLPENILYGMQQLQHYNFRWQTLIHKYSVVLLNGFTQPSSAAILPTIWYTYQKKYYLVTWWPP